MNDQQTKTDHYVDGNKFFILHEFNDSLRNGIIIPLTKKIEELSKLKDPGMIEFHINSRGGDAALCLHILNLIELAKSRGIKVRTIVLDRAYSAGSIIAVGGTPGERYISDTGEYCLHYGTHYGWEEHTPLQTERNAAHKLRHFAKLKAIYEKYCVIPKLEEQLKDDSFFVTADEAIKWKLADKLIGEMS